MYPAAPSTGLPPGPPLAKLLGQAADAVAAVRAGRSLTDALARCQKNGGRGLAA